MSTSTTADAERRSRQPDECAGSARGWGRHLRPLPAVTVAAAAGLGLGVLSAYGQSWLPESVGSLANSTGSWTLAAFLLALMAPTRISAALSGFAALACMLLGYVVANEIHGYPSSSGLMVFWGAAALVAGPSLGLGAHWLRWTRGPLAALGIGGMSGILVGEGAYGLLYIADTTSPPYWWGQIAVGSVLLAAASTWRLRRWSTAALGVLVTVLVAVVFVVLYSRGGAIISVL